MGLSTVGYSSRRLDGLALTERQSIEAGPVAAWSGFALATWRGGSVIRAWCSWARAAALGAVETSRHGSTANIVSPGIRGLARHATLRRLDSGRPTAACVLAGDVLPRRASQARIALFVGRSISPIEPVGAAVERITGAAGVLLVRKLGAAGFQFGGCPGRWSTAARRASHGRKCIIQGQSQCLVAASKFGSSLIWTAESRTKVHGTYSECGKDDLLQQGGGCRSGNAHATRESRHHVIHPCCRVRVKVTSLSM